VKILTDINLAVITATYKSNNLVHLTSVKTPKRRRYFTSQNQNKSTQRLYAL